MYQRVVSQPNGNVIFFYNSKKITHTKSGIERTDIVVYNKKEVDELYSDIHLNSSSHRGY